MAALPQQNRYLWVQFVGLAAVPLLLDICLAGLASARTTFGYPSAFGLQYWLIVAVCILPPLAMQCLRPFYIFSVPPLALKPSALTTNQRRYLRLLESWQIKALAVGSAGLSLWLLSQLYARSPQITPMMTPNSGLITAVVAFFWACTFLQISISSARLLLVGPEAMKRVTPYEPPAIAPNFLLLGLRVGKILPEPAGKAAVAPKSSTPERKSSYDKDTETQTAQDNAVLTELSEAEVAAIAESELVEPELAEPELTEPELTEQTTVEVVAPLGPKPDDELTVASETESSFIDKNLSEPSGSTATEPVLESQANDIEANGIEANGIEANDMETNAAEPDDAAELL